MKNYLMTLVTLDCGKIIVAKDVWLALFVVFSAFAVILYAGKKISMIDEVVKAIDSSFVATTIVEIIFGFFAIILRTSCGISFFESLKILMTFLAVMACAEVIFVTIPVKAFSFFRRIFAKTC